MTVVQRIEALRQAMREHDIQACVVPTSDPHLSEYLPDRWQGREWLSGFTGSAGTLVVCLDAAALWTDSRYWEQAEAELDGSGITLMRSGQPGVLSPHAWVANHLEQGASVAIDGQVLSVQSCRQWQEATYKAGLKLLLDLDLPGQVWLDRPNLPQGVVQEFSAPWACRSRQDNLTALRAEMGRHGADWHLISALDDIAWLFNLRGTDIPYNPVFLSHALVGKKSARLFVDASKMGAELRSSLEEDGVALEAYEDISGAL